jgi:Trypsin-like peptidase domain
MEVIAFGFPFGTALAPDRKGYPAVSVNAGSVTSLRQVEGRLHRIQLDAVLNPGNSGGPVLDGSGKVVGVVVAGVEGRGVNFAIPANEVTRFVSRPEIQFDPPVLNPANVYKPVMFEVGVVPIVPSPAPVTVDLILKPARGSEQVHRMKATGTSFGVSAVPVPPPPGALRLRLVSVFDDGTVNATTSANAEFKVANRAVKLSEVRSVRLGAEPRVVFGGGEVVEGPVTGLGVISIELGGQPLSLDVSKATEIKVAPAVESDLIWYTLLVREGDKEVFRQTESLVFEGLLPVPNQAPGPKGIRPPALEGNLTVRELSSPAADVAVGGAGRYLVLHLPEAKRLAVFDVNAADFVGSIPLKEETARFAAGLEDVVVVLGGSGTIERWSLKTLKREVSTALPIKGVIKAVAMGAASTGPLLVHWAAGTQELDRAGFALYDVARMRLRESDIKIYPALANSYRDIVHLRASANGRLFGMWCTSHSPSGVGVIAASELGTQSYYAHTSLGHVVPGPDGKELFTGRGTCAPQVSLTQNDEPQGGPVLPATHGDYFLRLAPAGTPNQGARPLRNAPNRQPAGAKTGSVAICAVGREKPIATVADLDVSAVGEEWTKHDFIFDKRVHLIPDARLIITIPASNDRLVLRRFGN